VTEERVQTQHDDHDDIINAAQRGDVDEVAALLSIDNRLTRVVSPDGWTPLHLAAHYGHAAVVETLLANNADVGARSENAMRNQPLHAAAAGKQVAVSRMLLAAGADVNARQAGGYTPLHSAAQNGVRALVELLLAHGADIAARSDDGASALALAEKAGRHEVAELLRARDAG
jgi:ankyrin repeat protein